MTKLSAIATYGPPDIIKCYQPSADKIRSTLGYPDDYPFIPVEGLKEVLVLFEENGKIIAYKLNREFHGKYGRTRLEKIGGIHIPLELRHSGDAVYIRMKD